MAAPPQFVSVCTGLGVTLPILQPLAGNVVDPLISALTNNINTNFQQTLSGRTIGVGVLDPATNTIATVPANQCNISANSFAVDNANGVAIGGGQITGLGGTGNALPTAGSPGAIALGNGATTAAGTPNAIAIGTGANATAPGGVALGAGSVAARPAQTYVDPFTGASLTTNVGALSVGQPGQERQVTNVAAGNLASDAVDVGQLQGALAPLSAASRLGVTYVPDANRNPTAAVNLAGNPNLPAGTTQASLTGVAPGALTAGSTDAVNGAQLGATGTSTAAALGAGATFNPATGQISTSSFTVQGANYPSVGSAFGAVDSALNTIGGQLATINPTGAFAPVQFSTAAAPTTPNAGVPSNDATLVGANAAAPVALHNVAPGTIAAGATDAANTGQLYAGNQSVATILGGGATYNTGTGTVTNPNYTIQGTSYTTIGGALNALSGSVNGMGNTKYFQANSSQPNAAATAPESIAIGPVAVASAPSAVAIGNGATSSGINSVALGAGSTDGGEANVVSVGAPGAERRITNVASGRLAAGSTDAVTGGQLNATNTQLASLGHSTVQYATDATGATLSSVTLASDQGGPVTIHNLAPGVVANDAATVGQVQAANANAVQYTVTNGVRSNTVALTGGSPGGVTISNLAAGVGPSDAVNVAQLQSSSANVLGQAQAYTNQQVNNLAAYTQRQIRRARDDAAGGTALALAATGLRYDDRPGKTSITGATSYYHDQAGIAFGIGYTSQDGRYRFNGSLTASPTMSNPDVGAVVGASMALN